MLLDIPTKPESLSKIRELIKNNFGINSIAEVISKDIYLASTVIRVANTSFFSRGRKIDSIGQAANIIGIKRLETIATHAALKNNSSYIGLDHKVLDVLWSHSELVAAACDLIAGRCYKEARESAYMAGLFHDCAVPLFIKRFESYKDNFFRAMRGCDTSIILLEQEAYNMDHATVSSLICEKWGLPEDVIIGVKYHHYDYKNMSTFDNLFNSKNFYMIAILVLADQFVQNIDLGMTGSSISMNEWINNNKKFISVLGINDHDILDLKEDFLDKAFSNL